MTGYFKETFRRRTHAVKVTERKVRNVMKTFTAQNVTDLDLDDFKSRLKEIRNSLDEYNNVVIEFVLDLNEDDASDEQRITNLEAGQDELLKEILANESEVQVKVKELLKSKPLSKAEEA